MPKIKKIAGLLVLLFSASTIFAVDAETVADKLLDKRLSSFLAGGYDPLTAPPGWFDPTERVSGGGLPDPVVATAKERTIAGGALAMAEAYAESKDSLALIIVRGGRIEFERYWQGAGRDTIFNPQSMSKTLLALAVGVAIDEGYITSVNDPIDKYLPRLKNDPRGSITIKNLLQMSGGLAQISTSYDITPDNKGVKQHFGSDFIGPIFELKLVDKPGTRWEYNNNETNLLGYLLTQVTGMRYASWLSEKIWQPLGLKDAEMYLDRPGGNVMMSCCILSRPIDFVRVGMMMRDQGRVDGKQIVPADWVKEMIKPSETSKGYGYQTWIGDRDIQADYPEGVPANYSWASESYAAEDSFHMSGHGFQRVWIIPSRDLVILRAGRTWPAKWDESAIPNVIVRAIDSMNK